MDEIMDIILLLLIATTALVSFYGFNNHSFFEKFKFNVSALKNGQYYRLFTSSFLHGDTQHLLFNMITLYFFAPIVINSFGPLVFLGIYTAGMISGGFLSYFINLNKPYYSAIGASDAVTAILFAAIVLNPSLLINFIIPAWLFGILYIGYSIYAMKKNNDNIGHAAHIGGAVAGYVIILLLKPDLLSLYPLRIIGIAIPMVVLGILIYLKKI